MREHFWAAGLASTSALCGLLPARPRYALASRIGRAVGGFFPMKRAAVERNLAVINERSGRRFKSEDVFRNFGVTLSDFLGGRVVDIAVEGREHAEAARAVGRGVLVLTSHLGNWELGGRVLADWGWPVTAVFQPYKSRAMQRFIQKRRAPTLRYLAVGRGAAHGVGKVLKNHGSVVMLADRPFGEDGATVTLCGRPARLPRGPFLFACRFNTPVIPGFVVMDRPGHYRTIVEAPLWPEGPDAVKNLMDKMALVLEKYLTLYADQWYCFEPVWDL
ncbi:MAG: lysophospholipid acyltransferase family protein [Elusimicrobia bacterium]|nr:lysophospholipid acyltransferase family protein [Elusimicrobiota bacterium]MBK7206722.1 lysophospholipid acyltransferase family protein [Elusimicrobiota bacterium]MBK7545519.1 lysophospholipid acyltransferase family protein [Elusimicrobiota bacterium]MBK7575290.1 lysophospholipid acyltransferase family protein [Elusimicrobiota bacterium]MBK7687931.1 lysophospholipid acyltransferase family protein [Elusimicrobiota bacterium]